jgi:hypothetical protein
MKRFIKQGAAASGLAVSIGIMDKHTVKLPLSGQAVP